MWVCHAVWWLSISCTGSALRCNHGNHIKSLGTRCTTPPPTHTHTQHRLLFIQRHVKAMVEEDNLCTSMRRLSHQNCSMNCIQVYCSHPWIVVCVCACGGGRCGCKRTVSRMRITMDKSSVKYLVARSLDEFLCHLSVPA